MVNPVTLWHYLRARFNIASRSDEGVVTTEVAVIVFLIVASAIIVVGILMNAAQNNAESVPVPEAP
jgi:hypothetical protein